MAHYFFHVLDGKVVIDTKGSDLPGIEQARDEAIHTAGQVLRSRGTPSDGRPWRMVVADADANVVFSLEFSADRHGF
jgi:hypothetical protein